MNTSKIIKGVVGGGRYTVTAPIVKEDYGLYLKIEGLELPQTYEVDFSNDEHSGTSVTMIGNADGVLIPHQFIDTGKDIFAFLYHVGVDYGRTLYKFRIPNKLRPDRTNEQPTPEEQSTIDQAISALNSAVAQTAQDVIDADASAQSAQGYAESAEGYAESASTSASNALASETNAERYADRAETAESHAQDYASQASGSALSADDSAETAEAYATGKRDGVDVGSSDPTYHNNSKYYSEQASASATTASTKAGEASESASTASSKATEASGYASTASTKAGEASTSAQTASTKASEASGYATTASNKATEASGYATSASQAKTDAESARDSAQGYASDAQGYANDAQASAESVSASASQIAKNTADILKAFPTDTASGAVASFTDGADGIPLKSLIVNIDPVQDLSNGDPSPDNICPMSGWTGMQLSVNETVIPISWQTEAGTVYGGKLDVLSGVMTVTHSYMQLVLTGWALSGSNFWHSLTTMSNTRPAQVGWCTHYKNEVTATGNNTIIFGYSSFSASPRIIVRDSRFTTASDFMAFLAEQESNDTPVMIAYPLATPIEVQLDAHAINSIYGQNNIFADTGDTTCEYRADTKLYIEKLTQPTEDDMVADSAITSGQFFMIGNSLYKALTAIASGATITVGTNAQRVSLADALNLINT